MNNIDNIIKLIYEDCIDLHDEFYNESYLYIEDGVKADKDFNNKLYRIKYNINMVFMFIINKLFELFDKISNLSNRFFYPKNVKIENDKKSLNKINRLIDAGTEKYKNFEPIYGQNINNVPLDRNSMIDAGVDPDKINAYLNVMFNNEFRVYSKPIREDSTFGTVPVSNLIEIVDNFTKNQNTNQLVNVSNTLEKTYHNTTINNKGILINIDKENINELKNKIRVLQSTIVTESFNILMEKTNLKYDYRYGFDYDTGHQLEIQYELVSANNVVGVGDMYRKSKSNKNKNSKEEILNDVKNNIHKKGNNDHISKNCKCLMIKDLVTNKILQKATIISPMFVSFHGFGGNRTALPSSVLKRLKFFLKSNFNKKNVSTAEVGKIDPNATFKATTFYNNTTNSKRNKLSSKISDNGTDMRLIVQGINERLKYARPVKSNDINVKNSSMLGDRVIFNNPNKEEALKELNWRLKDIRKIIKTVSSNEELSFKRYIRMVKNDIRTIENGHYDVSMMKKYRVYDGDVVASNKERSRQRVERQKDLANPAKLESNKVKILNLIKQVSFLTMRIYSDVINFRLFMLRNISQT